MQDHDDDDLTTGIAFGRSLEFPKTIAGTSPPVLTVDYEFYAHYLEDSDLNDVQKQELLQMIWNVVMEFVSIGYGIHPVQQAQNACGKEAKPAFLGPLAAPDMVNSGNSILSKDFIDATDLAIDRAAEEQTYEIF